jgi:hypothetical protein
MKSERLALRVSDVFLEGLDELAEADGAPRIKDVVAL